MFSLAGLTKVDRQRDAKERPWVQKVIEASSIRLLFISFRLELVQIMDAIFCIGRRAGEVFVMYVTGMKREETRSVGVAMSSVFFFRPDVIVLSRYSIVWRWKE